MSDRQGFWLPVIVAGTVTLLINVAGVAINFFLIDRVRLDIEQSNLELSRLRQATEDVKVGIEKEELCLKERAPVLISLDPRLSKHA